jgi:hypothetical protein
VKKTPPPQSATSLPRAPRDDAGSRSVKYLITMGIRIGCFVAMVFVTPYGWYTWVFAAGAIFLPYFAVVVANVGEDTRREAAVSPERTLDAPGSSDATAAAPPAAEPAAPPVIRISEAPPRDPEA